MLRRRFRAMGTDVELLLVAEPSPLAEAVLEGAEREFERLEAILTRFRPESELSTLNRRGRIQASDELLTVTELALEAREQTAGRFDPTVHDALVAAGYDRTFADVAPDGPSAPAAGPCGGTVTVDREHGTIELEAGVHLDFGGIGKGYAVDRGAMILSEAGPALVDAGGDIATVGRPDALGWRIGVETSEGTIALALEDGALATTGRDRRRWRRGGDERHHIIDPATGRPAASDLLRVTVVGSTAVEAEVLAKALFLAGAHEAAGEAEALGVPCILITEDERTVMSGGIA
jgi:thiamine biosynthesis lipoprotein